MRAGESGPQRVLCAAGRTAHPSRRTRLRQSDSSRYIDGMKLFGYSRASSASHGQRGFTLIESMVVVALTAVLAGLAAPSFIDSFRRYRVDATREDLAASINLARTEAIRTGQAVVLRRINACGVVLADNQDWSCGWQVFADPNGNNVLDVAEAPVQQVAVAAQITIRKANIINPQFVVIDRYGQVTQLGQRFEIFPVGLSAVEGQILCFTTGTRLRTFKNQATCP